MERKKKNKPKQESGIDSGKDMVKKARRTAKKHSPDHNKMIPVKYKNEKTGVTHIAYYPNKDRMKLGIKNQAKRGYVIAQ